MAGRVKDMSVPQRTKQYPDVGMTLGDKIEVG